MISRFINITGLFGKSLKVAVFFLLLVALGLGACSRKNPDPRGFWIALKADDTLESVARRFSVNRLNLQRINNIYDPNDIKAGIRILIPAPKGGKVLKKPERIKRPKPAKQVRRGKPVRLKPGKARHRFIWPVNGTISSGYGLRRGRIHQGIDLTKDRGRRIKAAADGIVKFAGWKKGFGKTVILDHGRGVTSLYAHNSKIHTRKNRKVRQGAVIARMGSTGTSNGVHLHFEIRINDKPTNPLRYLPVR